MQCFHGFASSTYHREVHLGQITMKRIAMKACQLLQSWREMFRALSLNPSNNEFADVMMKSCNAEINIMVDFDVDNFNSL